MKTYAAWTRTAKSNDQFCTQIIEASSKKEAKQKIIAGNREIQKGSEVYLY